MAGIRKKTTATTNSSTNGGGSNNYVNTKNTKGGKSNKKTATSSMQQPQLEQPMDELMDNASKPMDVMDALSIISQSKEQNKTSTEVIKDVPVMVDVGNLLVVDPVAVELSGHVKKAERELWLREQTRENVQSLFNDLWTQPRERSEVGLLAKLPQGTFTLPREKKIPEGKKETRWEKFAKEKGIVKRKRERMVYDETQKEYRPRFGYGRVDDEKNTWILEVPKNADPYEDQFEKMKEAKKARIDKNQKQQLRNRKESGILQSEETLSAPAPVVRAVKKQRLEKNIVDTKVSTASMGRFDRTLENEPKIKGTRNTVSNKRQFAPVAIKDSSGEKTKSLDVLRKISNGESVLDVTKATGRHIQQTQGGGGATSRVMKQGRKNRGGAGKVSKGRTPPTKKTSRGGRGGGNRK